MSACIVGDGQGPDAAVLLGLLGEFQQAVHLAANGTCSWNQFIGNGKSGWIAEFAAGIPG